jgi:hypothetical protein
MEKYVMATRDVTFRLIELGGQRRAGQTAINAELAKLVPGNLDRSLLLGIERTEWEDYFGKKRPQRTVLIAAEDRPGQWSLGAELPAEPAL